MTLTSTPSWTYIAHQRNSSGQQGAGEAIMADPRWPVLQRQLAAFAHEVSCPWDGGLQGWMQWQPTDCRTLCWNEIAQNMSAAAIDAASVAAAAAAVVRPPSAFGRGTDPLGGARESPGWRVQIALYVVYGSHLVRKQVYVLHCMVTPVRCP